MPNDNLTEITLVLDRSGSMSSIKAATIEGFNKFLAEQQKLPGACLFSLTQFDHEFEVVHSGKPIKEVPLLSDATFLPRGNTALYDAVGRTIVTLGDRLAKTPEEQRPGKIMFVIMTDGHENASTEYTNARVKEMIKHQEEKYSWNFIFLGANIDVQKVAVQGLGISFNNAVSYNANEDSMKGVMRSVSASAGRYRMGTERRLSHAFTDDEKNSMKTQK